MPKIKIPKSSPSIDMTPMVDLAFLLVTFFMLAANFKSQEPVDVTTPSSTIDKIIPENIMTITIDKGGRIFLNLKGAESRREMLQYMLAKYKNTKLSPEQVENFVNMESFGCSMSELPQYVDMKLEERRRYETEGIPIDTLAKAGNQLKDWVFYGNIAALNTGQTEYLEAKGKGQDPDPNDFKPKFILKVDGKAAYVHAKRVIDTFRDLHLNNLNFMTSLEQAPK